MTARHKIHDASTKVWSFATESRHLPSEIALGTEVDEFDRRMRFASLCHSSGMSAIAALGFKYACIFGLPVLLIIGGVQLISNVAAT